MSHLIGSPAKRLMGNASWYVSERLVRMAGAFVVGAWVARTLGPERYGTLAFAAGLIALLGFLGSLGVESLIVRDLVGRRERSIEVLTTYIAIRGCGALLVPILACLYIWVPSPQDTELLLIAGILSSAVLLSSLEAADSLLQAQHEARVSALIRLSGFIVSSLFKCSLVIADATLFWFAIATVSEQLVCAALFWRVLARRGARPSWRRFDWQEARILLWDGRLMILSGLTVVIYSKIDLLVIGELISKAALANYAIAATMCAAWNMLGMSLAQAAAPYISAALTKGEAAYISALRRFLVFMIAIPIAGSLVLSNLGGWIFSVLLGPDYAQGAIIFSILVWGSVSVFVGVATSQIVVNEKLYGISLLRTAVGMAVMLTLVGPIAINYGVIGVAWLSVCSASMAALALLIAPAGRARIISLFRSVKH